MSNKTLGQLMTEALDTKLDTTTAASIYATKTELANAGGGGMTEQEVAAAFQQHYGTLVCYTLAIDEANESPGDACTYADDAYGMTKGSSDWDTMPIFKDIKPCVFKDGEVVYYLNPNNWNEKVDGTASDLTGGDGDVMIEFPKFAYRIYRNGNTLYVSVTNNMWLAAVDGRFNLDAFSRIDVGDLEHFYQGAYKGYLDTTTGKLRSIAGVLPTGNKKITEFRTAAQLNGAHYQQSVYSHIKALQCLYLIKYGNRDGQAALGKGVTSGSLTVCGYNVTNVSNIDSVNSTAEIGMYYGDTFFTNKHMRFAGIEDFWGNIHERIDGITTDAKCRRLINTNYSGENNVKLKNFISTGGTSISGYMQLPYGNSNEGFIGMQTCSTQYWNNHIGIAANCTLYFGGYYGSSNGVGPFHIQLVGSSSSSSIIGARLTFH